MFDGRRSRRGCLLPVAVALVAAMVCAFGSASTLATAESEETKTTTLKVTGVEKGVKGTAYKYMDVKGSGGESTELVEKFDSSVGGMVEQDFKDKNYTDNDKPTENFKDMGPDGRNAFADKLFAVITNDQITSSHQVEGVTGAGGDSKVEISFTLPAGGYVIKLSNGSSHIYDPIFAYIWPKSDGTLQVGENFDRTHLTSIGVKSKEITSTKTVGEDKKKAHGQINEENSLTYKIKTPIPKYPANASNKKFGVEDHPDLGLTIKSSSIRVQIGEGGRMLSEGKDYSKDVVGLSTNRDVGFRVQFTKEQYEKLAVEDGEEQQQLIVTYNGKLNEAASIKGGTKNYARPLIPKDSYSSPSRGEDADDYTDAPPASDAATTTVYTYGVKLTKVDSENDERLEGAEFKLYKKGDTATEIKVKKQSAGSASVGQASTATGMYVVQEAGSGGSATITSNADGVVQIDGLNAGVTYILKETKVPEGYDDSAESMTEILIKDENLDGEPDSNSMIGTRTIAPDKESNRLSYKITNKKKKPAGEEYDFTLPKTGAMGTAAFSAIGVALVAAGVALVAVVRRRKVKRAKRSS